jgi:hypothetical protein
VWIRTNRHDMTLIRRNYDDIDRDNCNLASDPSDASRRPRGSPLTSTIRSRRTRLSEHRIVKFRRKINA